MKKTLGAVAVLMFVASPALAQYGSIAHSLFTDAGFNTSFNAGVLNISSSNPGVSLFDPGPGTLPGSVSNVQFDMTSSFTGFDLGKAQFTGGSISLTFDYTDGGTTSHEISGPITGLLFDFPVETAPGSGIYRIDGIGRWTATTKNLPGSGNWDDGGGFSSIDSLTLNFGQDLSSFDWANDVASNGKTAYQLFPNDSAVPEPATLALLSLGAFAVLRRRS